MRPIIRVFSLLACVCNLDAQITASLKHLPAGKLPDGATIHSPYDEVTIRNDSTQSLVAFAVTVRQTPRNPSASSAPLVVYSDPLIESLKKPLAPGEERMVMRGGVGFSGPGAPGVSVAGARVFDEPVVVAGILADGAVTGDAGLMSRILARRSNMLMAVETTLETLLEAGTRNVPRDQLIRQFRRLADSIQRWYIPPEQQIALVVYQSMIGKLTKLPQEELGSPFPPAAFVAQETAALNRLRVTLVESQPSLLDATLVSTR